MRLRVYKNGHNKFVTVLTNYTFLKSKHEHYFDFSNNSLTEILPALLGLL